MLTEQDIEKFYCDLESMKLRKPNAVMKKASGLSSGNVSEYLNKKKPPSESFIKAFYEKVYKPSTNALLAEKKEEKNNNDNDTLATIRDIARSNVTLADANKVLADNNSDLIGLLKKANSSQPQDTGAFLFPYLQRIALGGVGKFWKDVGAGLEELSNILHEYPADKLKSHN